jgi:hypothetical protein
MVTVDSARLTPELLDAAAERGVRIAIGGWDGPEDSALLNRADPGPWQAMLDAGHSALTDQPATVLDLLGR